MDSRQKIREERCREQATKGLERINNHLENNDDIGDNTKQFMLQLADRYMNIITFLNDYQDQTNSSERGE